VALARRAAEREEDEPETALKRLKDILVAFAID
jgi:hypothetical protein